MMHEQHQNAVFLGQVFNELHLSATHHALGLHAVAARYLPVHVHQFVAAAKRNAHVGLMFQHVKFAARRAGVQVDNAVLVGKIHGNHIGMAVLVGDAHHAIGAAADNTLNLLIVCNGYGLHIAKILVMQIGLSILPDGITHIWRM